MNQWNELLIAGALTRQTFASKCVVMVPNCVFTGHECDVLAVTADMRIIDVEIKISRADLRADAGKDKWWHRFPSTYDAETRKYTRAQPVHRDWPRMVWKHYYALPKDIWNDSLLDDLGSSASGVLLLSRGTGISSGNEITVDCRRRAKPNRCADRLSTAQVTDLARLANLRMWDAIKLRERIYSADQQEKMFT